jgi:predicted hydrolase (HD superfamily)
MIPTEHQAKELWIKYSVPSDKQKHLFLVATLAKFFAERIVQNNPTTTINIPLVVAVSLLHDIDKSAGKLPGENHPDTGVRILKEEGMEEVAHLVKNHPLHCILDPETAPKSLEEKIVFLSDKMVKYEIITVDKRFDLWRNEPLSEQSRIQLEKAYPNVKELEKELFFKAGLTEKDMTTFASTVYTE